MSTEAPQPAKWRIVSRYLPQTLASKVSSATAVALLFTVGAVWVFRWFGRDNVSLLHAMTWLRFAVELGLALVIPMVVYWGIRRWNEVIEGLFPDIDQAWKAGVAAMEANGIRFDQVPIFLIVGSTENEGERGLMSAAIPNPAVEAIPQEPGVRHALQWYASDEAIYLFCTNASSLSGLVRRWERFLTGGATPLTRPVRPSEPVAAGKPVAAVTAAGQPQQGGAPQSAADLPGGASPAQADAASAAPRYLQTIDASQFESDSAASPTAAALPSDASGPKPPTPAAAAGGQNAPQSSTSIPPSSALPVGTIDIGQLSIDPATGVMARSTAEPGRQRGPTTMPGLDGLQQTAASQLAAATPKTRRSARIEQPVSAADRRTTGNVALPPSLDTSEQLPRLQYVCQLLRRIRRPRCGANGIVTLIPFELSRAGPRELTALSQSARNDLETIQRTLKLRCPVTALLVGMEQDRGFAELVRRLPPELLTRRLGGRFDLRNRPTPIELNDHSDRLCDAFEDWVYRLLARDDALAQQRGNRRLYGLLSRIRHELKPRLRIVLGRAFGCQPGDAETAYATQQADDSFLFSGCYFASSGAAGGPAAFVRGVLPEKIFEEQSQVEWLPDALRVHTYFRLAVVAGWTLLIVLVISLLVNVFRS